MQIFKGLTDQGFEILPFSRLGETLSGLQPGIKISVDGVSCSQLVYDCLRKNDKERVKELSGASSPVSKLKIIKNDTELSGLRKAMARESASLISTYATIKSMIKESSFREHQGE